MATAILSKPADDSTNSVYRPIVYEVECPDVSGSLQLVRASVKLYLDTAVINANNPIIQDPDLVQTGASSSHTKFTFDVSGVVRNYITSDLQALGGEGTLNAPNSLKVLFIAVGGIYKNTSTNELTEAEISLFTNEACNIFNGVYQHKDTQGFTAFELGTSTKKFLTNFPSSEDIKIKTSESYFLSGIDLNTSSDTHIEVLTMRSRTPASFIDVYKIEATNANTRYDFGVGCSNFANLVSGDMDSLNVGTLPIITSEVIAYTVWVYDIGVGTMSETMTFEIDRKAHDYSTRFHWLNRLGGFDSWTFDGASSRGQNQSKALYEQNLDYSFNIYDSETGINAIESKNTFSSYSGLLSGNKRKWLEELYTSPEVYVVEDGAYVPILITDSQVKTIDDDKNLIQVKINYTYSHQNVINV